MTILSSNLRLYNYFVTCENIQLAFEFIVNKVFCVTIRSFQLYNSTYLSFPYLLKYPTFVAKLSATRLAQILKMLD